ncbi:hypothetical protein C7N43_03670 [Sphingobacteriales bacterium UPWRP_1]|nr:hypothetical protein BVG80_08080 [Sphingobacteriales bacterium TSM_CSM]PSJ78440.1 hypothetical protein C7N43_03670 [Sphingobacteriales bacterium UPWRP_1]
MSRTRFKTANIVFFLLLILLIVYLFNRQKAEQKFIEWGLKNPPDTTTVLEMPSDTSLQQQPPDTILNNSLLPGLQPPDTNGLATWRILTQSDAGFYVGGPNRFMVQAAEIDPQQITPVVSGSRVVIETIDKDKGLYRLNAQEAGKAEISLFYVNSSGAADILGSQSFTIHGKAPARVQQPDASYLWSIVTQQPDTLLYGNNNPLMVAVAETAPQNIEASISGQGNELLLTDTANAVFNAVIRTGGNVTITVRITNGTQTRLLGSKTFVVKTTGEVAVLPPVNTGTAAEPYVLAQHNPVLYAGIANTIYLLPMFRQPATWPVLQTNNGTITQNNGTCTLIPAQTGLLQLSAQGTNGNLWPNKQFEVIQTPNPIITLAGSPGGDIPVALLREATRPELIKPAGFTKPDFTLLSFDAVFYSAGRGLVKITNTSPVFNPETTRQLMQMKPTDLLYLNNIQVTGTDGSKRTLPATVFAAR